MICAYVANASLCNIPFLFLCFLCHPYIFTIFVENFYCSLDGDNNLGDVSETGIYHVNANRSAILIC